MEIIQKKIISINFLIIAFDAEENTHCCQTGFGDRSNIVVYYSLVDFLRV